AGASLGRAALDVHARVAMASDYDSYAHNGGGSESGSKTPSASPSAIRTPAATSPGPVAGVYGGGRHRARGKRNPLPSPTLPNSRS
ncbi:unnamed protein product, partial [Urochloa humidicola]